MTLLPDPGSATALVVVVFVPTCGAAMDADMNPELHACGIHHSHARQDQTTAFLLLFVFEFVPRFLAWKGYSRGHERLRCALG